MNSYHFGDMVSQYGDGNVGMIKNQGPVDAQAAFREMINAVEALRSHVSAQDLQIIDESMNTIGKGGNTEQQTLRRALGNIAGIATMVGQVGVPVIEAIRRVMTAVGM